MGKKCAFIGCSNNVFAKGYCLYHQYARTDKKKPQPKFRSFKPGAVRSQNRGMGKASKNDKKPPKPIARNSAKRASINRTQYEPRARAFREEKGCCEVCPILRANGIATRCSGEPEAVHHKKGKATIELLLDVRYWMASCFWANSVWIEENSAEAERLGLKIPDYNSKLSKFKK